jgi:ribose 5-phosphate isomerase B
MKTIALGSDHAGFSLKEFISSYLKGNGYEIVDYGAFSEESVDYPYFARKVANAVAEHSADCGILFCGTGIGVSIAANKVKGIRAALVYNSETAVLAKQHNDANIICLGARFIAPYYAQKIVESYLTATFEGGKHQIRLDKIEKDDE